MSVAGFSTEALRVMASKGLTLEDVIEISEAMGSAERSAAAVRTARYRQRGGGKIPQEMRQQVFERDGFACLECSSQDYLQCDHIHPVSKGGETTLANLQTLCRVCNARKKDRIRKSNGTSVEVPRKASPNDIDILSPPPVPLVSSDELTSPAVDSDDLKPEHVIEAWNCTADRLGLKAVRKFTPQRRRKLQLRIRQNTIDEFTEAITAIERSPFLRGENDRGWRADFDWMLEPKNFTKLIEGTYDR